jgi:hypothetical protein
MTDSFQVLPAGVTDRQVLLGIAFQRLRVESDGKQ